MAYNILVAVQGIVEAFQGCQASRSHFVAN